MGLVPIQTCRDQCRQEIIAAAARAAFGDGDTEVDLKWAKMLLANPNEAVSRSDRLGLGKQISAVMSGFSTSRPDRWPAAMFRSPRLTAGAADPPEGRQIDQR